MLSVGPGRTWISQTVHPGPELSSQLLTVTTFLHLYLPLFCQCLCSPLHPFLLSVFCCRPLPSFIPPPGLLAFFIRLVSVLCNEEIQQILEAKNVNTPVPRKSHIDITEKVRWISLTLELEKLMQEDYEFETSLGYTESLLLNKHKQTDTKLLGSR